jgi:hypothetical protein
VTQVEIDVCTQHLQMIEAQVAHHMALPETPETKMCGVCGAGPFRGQNGLMVHQQRAHGEVGA